MFNDDGSYNFHKEIMALAEKFCQEWQQRQEPFKSDLEGALVFNFALNTIKHDLEELVNQFEHQPVFKGISPKEVYEQGQYGDENPKGLSDNDISRIVRNSLLRLRRN